MGESNDLTTLADCKAWLGVTSTIDDALITSLIHAISRAILTDIGRVSVLPTMMQETLDGNGGSALALRHWPISRLISCSIGGVPTTLATVPGQSGGATIDPADPTPPGAMQRLLFVDGIAPIGRQRVVVTYRAGYEILAEPAVVPAVAPYSVTVQAPYGSWAIDSGVLGASGAYTATGGVYTFGAPDSGTNVTLSYGYVPNDLARAACEWVADRYAARTRIGQSAKTLGGQETASFIVKAMPDLVSRLLQPYRRVSR